MALPAVHLVEATIFALLDRRRPDATICPSEVARVLHPGEGWRRLMPRMRRVGALLAARGRLVVSQRGEPVEALRARGPIRFGRPASGTRRR